MAAYYNEIDAYAAQWLRNLIARGLIPTGEVDERSIVDVHADDLGGFVQCHFFAGLGGWAYALRLAGWPDERPIWTGSCPCQPFSVAGRQLGADDPRHLWPDFFRLIRSRRPVVVMGEQVAGASGYGWLDGVVADLAGEDYAARGVDIPACAVDAPHIRNRLYWVARDMADADESRRGWRAWDGERVIDGQNAGRSQDQRDAAGGGGNRYMADADIPDEIDGGIQRGGQLGGPCRDPRACNGTFWSDAIWLNGADGKARRAQPGVPLLAHGIPNRVGRLRAYGNAIVPQLAAQVIAAFMEAQP